MNMRYSNGPIDTLGVKLPINNKVDIHKLNYDPNNRELEMLSKVWNMCNMSIKGKTTIFKSLGLTKLLCLASVLHIPTRQTVDHINTFMFKFIWNNKMDKIKRSVMINTYENGGWDDGSTFSDIL